MNEFKSSINSACKEVSSDDGYRNRLFASMPERIEKVIVGGEKMV